MSIHRLIIILHNYSITTLQHVIEIGQLSALGTHAMHHACFELWSVKISVWRVVRPTVKCFAKRSAGAVAKIAQNIATMLNNVISIQKSKYKAKDRPKSIRKQYLI